MGHTIELGQLHGHLFEQLEGGREGGGTHTQLQ